VSARSNRRGRLVEFGEQLAGPLEQRAAFLCELEVTRAALEQADVQARLKLGNAARQRRLGPPRRARGFSEPSVPGDEVEIGEGEEVHLFHQ
jgi:hypothetical protein